MLSQTNLLIYICNLKTRKYIVFFSISFVCMFITLFYVPILFNMSIGRFPALQECPRRLFWCFLRCEKNQNDRFYDSCVARMFPTTVLVIPALRVELKRPILLFRKAQNSFFRSITFKNLFNTNIKMKKWKKNKNSQAFLLLA
jgi:hypothetical protein